MLKAKEGGKRQREAYVKEVGYVQTQLNRRLINDNVRGRYPAYITSAGWLGKIDMDFKKKKRANNSHLISTARDLIRLFR